VRTSGTIEPPVIRLWIDATGSAPSVSSLRWTSTRSSGGRSARAIRSTRKPTLSSSPHCRSSTATITGRAASPAGSSSTRSAAKPRRRSSCGSAGWNRRVAGSAIAGTRRSTGNSRASAVMSSGSSARELRRRQAQQRAGQRVDQRVERLERHRLALVAAAGQHQRAIGQPTSRNRVDQRRLAHARGAAHDHRDAGLARVEQRLGQRAELGDPADERRRHSRRCARRCGSPPTARGPSARSTAAPSGRSRGSDREQAQRTARSSVGRQVGHQRARRRRHLDLLAPHQLVGAPLERPPPGQRLVQHRRPTEYQSLAEVSGTSAACSGDMYAGVPTAARSWV
jgi:hypothetical protein